MTEQVPFRTIQDAAMIREKLLKHPEAYRKLQELASGLIETFDETATLLVDIPLGTIIKMGDVYFQYQAACTPFKHEVSTEIVMELAKQSFHEYTEMTYILLRQVSHRERSIQELEAFKDGIITELPDEWIAMGGLRILSARDFIKYFAINLFAIHFKPADALPRDLDRYKPV